jgi:hypothetical protein
MDQVMLVWERRGFSKVKYAIEIVKSYLLQEMEEYL